MKEIESYWKPKLLNEIKSAEEKIQQKTSNQNVNEHTHDCYVLSMFPYPSGQLHMGHVRVYSISDAMAYYYRMSGPHRVLHPMGWDAFGLPAENAAIERNLKPQDWTKSNISKMREQLDRCGFIFDWDREITTSDPLYYKWTQWIFLKMYEAGLAYQKEAAVNWDPIDKTVLADEQVDSEGRSWRSGAKVVKRNLKQWFFRTTEYSKNLYDGLDDPTLKDWRDIKKIQQHWIGECTGVKFHLEVIKYDDSFSAIPKKLLNESQNISVWTNRPEMVLGAAFVGIASKHVMAKPPATDQTVFSVFGQRFYQMKNIKVLNPFSAEAVSIPLIVFMPDETNKEGLITLFAEGSDAFFGTPEICETHNTIIKEINKNFKQKDVLSSNGKFQNCKEEFNGLEAKGDGKKAVIEYARKHKIGGYWTSSKLQDWPVSRQRYWGTPIPMVTCAHGCGSVPVKEESLPVLLPDMDTLKQKQTTSNSENTHSTDEQGLQGGGSPLLQATDWIITNCPNCGKAGAKRETDTMDTFVDSSWYFLRYLDPQNKEALTKHSSSTIEAESLSIGMPVDLYIGGKEHATLHMYFARFVTHFLYSIGVSPVKEPFKSLLVQGMVKGKSYRIKGSGQYIPPSQAEFVETNDGEKSSSNAVDKISRKPLVVDWEKMSKSKYNGADPNEVLEQYGMDTTRLLILSDVSPLSDRKWDPEDSYIRISNMQSKLLRLVKVAIDSSTNKGNSDIDSDEMRNEQLSKAVKKLWDARNFYVRGANNAYSETRNLSMVMARVQGLLSELSRGAAIPNIGCTAEYHRGLASTIILLTPLAPHFCAEMWAGLSDAVIQYHTSQNNNCDINDDFLWDKSVFHQAWPKLDHNYNLKLNVLKNGKELTTIPVATWRFNDLNEEDAFNLACCVDVVQKTILPYQESMKYKFSSQPNYEAVIDFHVKAPELPFEEHEARKKACKETKNEEKLAKKLAREARIAERQQAQKLKSENCDKIDTG
jgi:leucyl-tRNA synthetase